MYNAGGSQREDALKESGVRVSGGDVLIQVDTDKFPLQEGKIDVRANLLFGQKAYVPVAAKAEVAAGLQPSTGPLRLRGFSGIDSNDDEKSKIVPFLAVAATGVGVYLFRDQIKTIFTRTR